MSDMQQSKGNALESRGVFLLIPPGNLEAIDPYFPSPDFAYVCRYIYGNVLYKLLAYLLSRFALKAILTICGAPNDAPVYFWFPQQKEHFHWLHMVQVLFSFYLLGNAVLDTAETVSGIPMPQGRAEEDNTVNKRLTVESRSSTSCIVVCSPASFRRLKNTRFCAVRIRALTGL